MSAGWRPRRRGRGSPHPCAAALPPTSSRRRFVTHRTPRGHALRGGGVIGALQRTDVRAGLARPEVPTEGTQALRRTVASRGARGRSGPLRYHPPPALLSFLEGL